MGEDGPYLTAGLTMLARNTHYKLGIHHLRSLIRHVQQGGILQTHDDMPENIREQLIICRRAAALGTLANFFFPIGIPSVYVINILPGQSPQGSTTYSAAPTPAPADEVSSRPPDRLDIPGLAR